MTEAQNRKTNIGYSLIAAAIGIMIYLSSSKPQAPLVPSDAHHRLAFTNQTCVECHGAGKQSALKDSHPQKDDCISCHKSAGTVSRD